MEEGSKMGIHPAYFELTSGLFLPVPHATKRLIARAARQPPRIKFQWHLSISYPFVAVFMHSAILPFCSASNTGQTIIASTTRHRRAFSCDDPQRGRGVAERPRSGPH
jgi:hypothetical protein